LQVTQQAAARNKSKHSAWDGCCASVAASVAAVLDALERDDEVIEVGTHGRG
jgi:hypothetical protein